MKNKYVTPELEVTKFSVKNELLVSEVEGTLPGFGGNLDDDPDTPHSIGFSGPGFGF